MFGIFKSKKRRPVPPRPNHVDRRSPQLRAEIVGLNTSFQGLVDEFILTRGFAATRDLLDELAAHLRRAQPPIDAAAEMKAFAQKLPRHRDRMRREIEDILAEWSDLPEQRDGRAAIEQAIESKLATWDQQVRSAARDLINAVAD
ncbi:hypothetical protein [Flaviflagellibacter deserti]|uniref:Uncharacterized protein n=1 Tax=Flaviflagellibacter deserti TaxID=2267266 RepID=A0ABV9YWZ6_9HYPH